MRPMLARRLPALLSLLALACSPPAPDPQAPPPVKDILAWAPAEVDLALVVHRTTLPKDVADLAVMHFGGVPGVDAAVQTMRTWALGPMIPGAGEWGPGLALDRGLAVFMGTEQERVVFGARELVPALDSLVKAAQAAGLPVSVTGTTLSVAGNALPCVLHPPFAVCDSAGPQTAAPGRPAWATGDDSDVFVRITGGPLKGTPFEQAVITVRDSDTPLQVQARLRPEARGALAPAVPTTQGPSRGMAQVDRANSLLLKLGLDAAQLAPVLLPLTAHMPAPVKAAAEALFAAWSGDLVFTFDGGFTHPVLLLGLRAPSKAPALVEALRVAATPPGFTTARVDARRPGLRALRVTGPEGTPTVDLHYAVAGDTLVVALAPADVLRRTLRQVEPAELGVLGRKGVHGLQVGNPLAGMTSAWAAEVVRAGPVQDLLTLLGTTAALRGPLSVELEPTAEAVTLRVRWPVLGVGKGRDGFLAAMRAEMGGDQIKATRTLVDVAAAHRGSPYGVEATRRLASGDAGLYVGVVGVLASVAIPAFMKYQRRAKTSEATMNLRLLFDRAVEHAHRTGRLPPSAPLTPAQPACEGGQAVDRAPAPDAWAHAAWQALDFAPQDTLRYQYEFVSDGQRFTARALGDLNCDGVRATFERVGELGPDGTVSGGAGLYKKNELE